ncbi:hypothetical protein E2562_017614 [Oryza meyeriana var. granulata]|uniref:Uncharacterized protein n=1 Tax=Oryza meyeriana var. granulata TaxID=110450 RepID=A0A6G1BYA1_9ORYZ|nr:hypothetical protein E2562_017614 [Oryza meyeriana var. granulata]
MSAPASIAEFSIPALQQEEVVQRSGTYEAITITEFPSNQSSRVRAPLLRPWLTPLRPANDGVTAISMTAATAAAWVQGNWEATVTPVKDRPLLQRLSPPEATFSPWRKGKEATSYIEANIAKHRVQVMLSLL